MVDFPSATDAPRITTLRSLLAAGRGVESPGLEASPGAAQQQVAERYNSVVEKLAAETAKNGESVLITVQDRDASMLQSRLAEDGEAGPQLPTGGVEAQFGEGIWGGDVRGWFRSVFVHIDKTEWHPIVRPPDDEPGTFVDNGRIAALGDWGTNLYGAPVSAKSIRNAGGYALLLHLGETQAALRSKLRGSKQFERPPTQSSSERPYRGIQCPVSRPNASGQQHRAAP
jgi:hypothetical protein